jgi:hypothetical protein
MWGESPLHTRSSIDTSRHDILMHAGLMYALDLDLRSHVAFVTYLQADIHSPLQAHARFPPTLATLQGQATLFLALHYAAAVSEGGEEERRIRKDDVHSSSSRGGS